MARRHRAASGKVIGACWLGQLSPKWCSALGWGPEIELGYRYARAYWNRGYATEAARAMLDRGFNELGLDHIVAIVNIHNTASERVMQKLGMTLVASGQAEGITLRGYRIERVGHEAARSLSREGEAPAEPSP